MDLWDVDIRRMPPFQGNARLSAGPRGREAWACSTPCTGRTASPRPRAAARHSPLHERLAARGACFGEIAGWERPNWFARAGHGARLRLQLRADRTGSRSCGRRSIARCASASGLFDQSSFGKLLLEGRDAEAVLQRLCANDVAVAPGRVVYTQWLNERGGIEADLTVTRLADDAFLVIDRGRDPGARRALDAAPHPGRCARRR